MRWPWQKRIDVACTETERARREYERAASHRRRVSAVVQIVEQRNDEWVDALTKIMGGKT